MIADVLALLLVNGLLLAAGAGLTRAIGVWTRPSELQTVVATALLVGICAFGVVAQLLYVVGFSMSWGQSLVVCAMMAASAALARAPARPLSKRLPLTRVEWVAAVALAFVLILLAVDSLYQPLASWDAWSQWTPKAHALVQLDGLDQAVFGNAAYADLHPDYPLLIPALEALAFRFGVGARVVHFEFWLLLAAFVVSLVELLRPRAGALLAWSAAIAIAWTPKIGAEALSANADIPLAIFLALAGVAAWIWLSEGNPAALGLFAVFGSAATATKLEGVVELAIVLAVALAIALRQSRRDALLLGMAGAVTLVGLVPWRLWAIVVDAPATYSAGAASDNLVSIEPSRVPIAALLLVRQLFDPQLWLVLVPVAICAFVVASAVSQRHRAPAIAGAAALFVAIGFATAFLLPASSYEWRTAYWLLFLPVVVAGSATVVWFAREGGAAAFAGASVGGMLAALVGIYLFTPYDFAWHLGTSSSRVVVPPALFAAVFAPIVLAGATAGNAGRESP
jgi:hypothetical protein